MNIISIGAPNHTMKYFHIQHLINTKGSLSINVLNNVFQDQYKMKPSDKCQLTLNSCGKSTRSIFFNSPYGGITTLSEEMNVFGNVSMKGKKNISFQINHSKLRITEKEITIQAPVIRLIGHLEVDNREKVIVRELVTTKEIRKNKTLNLMNSYVVGQECHFNTIQSVLEFIELKSSSNNEPIIIRINNDKIYYETVNITRGNIHFIGENVNCFGSWFIHNESGYKIVFENINFNNIDNIYTNNKLKINSESEVRFKNCSFESMDIIFNSLSMYMKNCTFRNICGMSVNTTRDSHIVYSEFIIDTKNDLSKKNAINGEATIWVFCVSSTQQLSFDKKINLKKMLNII